MLLKSGFLELSVLDVSVKNSGWIDCHKSIFQPSCELAVLTSPKWWISDTAALDRPWFAVVNNHQVKSGQRSTLARHCSLQSEHHVPKPVDFTSLNDLDRLQPVKRIVGRLKPKSQTLWIDNFR